MDRIRQILGELQEKESLRAIRPVVEAAEAIIFASGRVTSSAPHILDSLDLKRYMLLVMVALMPATIAATYFYSWYFVAMVLISYIAGGLTEVLYVIIRKKQITEGFLVTGLIFPLVLPPALPLWMVAVGSVFGVFFGKELFGGTGRNIFNPALTGAVFLTIAFPVEMNTVWPQPLLEGLGGFTRYQVDAVTAATPLLIFQTGGEIPYSYVDLFFGRAPGSAGETFRLGIIISGLFLIIARVSNWRIPLVYLGSVVLLSGIGHLLWPTQVAPPLFQLLTGGLLFGAFFMATDPVTSPFTRQGKLLFGFLLGLFTVLIRGFAGAGEGVMFSILLGNALTPSIDNIVLKIKAQLRMRAT